MTISCARCHDHKFDPISQADYYAMYGVVNSTRPGREVIETWDRQSVHCEEIGLLKSKIKDQLALSWSANAKSAAANVVSNERLLRSVLGLPAPTQEPTDAEGSTVQLYQQAQQQYEAFENQWRVFDKQESIYRWDLISSADYSGWFKRGIGLPERPEAPGALVLRITGDQIVDRLLPGSVATNLISDKHAARLESPDFRLQGKYRLWVQVAGSGRAMARYVIQNYPRNGTVFPVSELKDPSWHWLSYDLQYWQGDLAHFEMTTALDAPLLVKPDARSWFAIRKAVLLPVEAKGPPANDLIHLGPLFGDNQEQTVSSVEGGQRESNADVEGRLANAITAACKAWQAGKMNDGQALWLDHLVALGVLSNSVSADSDLEILVSRFRQLENEIPVGTRVPVISDGVSADGFLFERGDHRRPAERVARRFLEVIDPTPYKNRSTAKLDDDPSGRLMLAEDLLRTDNPLTARVAVNRIWHHLFGQGIVRTPDNLGRLGAKPTHPLLLDYLASEFRSTNQWSIKSLVRRIVLSRTWRQSSQGLDRAAAVDPNNRLLSHASVRRLEAEAIRDTMLAVAGKLSSDMYGNAVAGDSDRRSIYVRVIRNRLDPFLTAFDAPVPFSAKGRRDITNVPAQSLLLMNSPRVRELAISFAQRTARSLKKVGKNENAERISAMWQTSLGRQPTTRELEAAEGFVNEMRSLYSKDRAEYQTLQARLRSTQRQLRDEMEFARGKYVAESTSRLQAKSTAKLQLKPVAEWLFDDLSDSVSGTQLKLQAGAALEAGYLKLDGGWAESGLLPFSLQEKSLEAVVTVDDLNQRGGGVISVQDKAGDVFDSLVFAERKSGEWLPGSNHFRRTQDLGGSPETDLGGTIHLVITYDAAGRISCFRNGETYGSAYQSSLQAFEAHNSMVLLGMRHGRSRNASRMFHGTIHEARLYDRALGKDEVEVLADRVIGPSEEQLLAAMLDDKQAYVRRLRAEEGEIRTQLEEYMDVPESDAEWVDLAQSLFNMKEFIYVR